MKSCNLNKTVYVIHVSKGYEERARHIESMLLKMGIEFQYILEGDKENIDSYVLDKYFSGEMHTLSSATSCALKHLLAYKKIIENKLEGALILEDDIILSKNFNSFFQKCLNEKTEKGIKDILLSFENTNLQFVSGSERKKSQHLYRASRDRYAGCYYITSGCAKSILDYVDNNKCHLPIDRFHTFLIDKIGLPYYWSHPTVATQGSKTGLFRSSISLKDFNRKLYLQLSHPFKLFYKRMLYRLR